MFSSSPKGHPSQFGLVYRHESGSRNFFEEHFQEDNIEAGVVSHYYTFIDAALAQMNLYYNPVNDIPGTRAGEAQLLDKQYPGHDRYGNYYEHFLRGEDFKNLSSLRKEMNDYNQRMKKILSLYWESTGRFGRRERYSIFSDQRLSDRQKIDGMKNDCLASYRRHIPHLKALYENEFEKLPHISDAESISGDRDRNTSFGSCICKF